MGSVLSSLLLSDAVIPFSLRSSRNKLLSIRKMAFSGSKLEAADKGEDPNSSSSKSCNNINININININTDTDTKKKNDNNDDESHHHWSVLVVLVAAFLNLLGFTMTGPITPALGKHFDLQVGASFGSLTSAYPLGMLFGLFVWPQLSDRLGRKPVIAASLFGSGFGLIAQSLVIRYNLPLQCFLATRVLTGCFAGSSPVSKAYLADVGCHNGKLPKYLAMRDAASTMAFVVGPLLGGIMFEIRRRMMIGNEEATMTRASILQTSGSLAFVIQISGIASIVAATLVAFCVRETPPSQNKKGKTPKNDVVEKNDPMCPLGIQMWAGIASVCAISFLYNVGDSTFHAFFSAMLRDQVHLDTQTIGMVYTALACVSFVVSTVCAGHFTQTYGSVAACAVGLSACAGGLILMGLFASDSNKTTMMLGAAALYHCGVPLYCPSIPTMLLLCVPSHRRGAVMGLDGTIKTFGRVVTPLVMGELYRVAGPKATFTVAGSVLFTAVATALIRRFMVLRATTTTIPPKNKVILQMMTPKMRTGDKQKCT